MRVVAFTPSRLNSQRVPQKNIKTLGGTPLINYALRTMNSVDAVDDIILFASEPSISAYIDKGLRYTFVQRPATLDTQEAKVQDLIREFLRLCDGDIIVMFHITSPFLRAKTVTECIEKVMSGKYDSAFTAFQVMDKCWFRDKPLNFSVEEEPRCRIEPVTVEHSLYVFKNDVFQNTGQRISANPYIKYVDHYEGHDIDTLEDFRIAELILSMGLT